jgi:predicted alpha/beta hydrolase family esterase
MYLFLPGNNKENKQWCESLRDSFDVKNKIMLYYDHWKKEGNIDWNTELNKTIGLSNKEKVIVIGKSAGCILGMKAQSLGYIDVSAYIFIGFPYYWAVNRGDNVDYLLENLRTKSLFIQKPKDPVIGYKELSNLLKAKGINVKTLEYKREGEENDSHDYKDISYLKEQIESFI